MQDQKREAETKIQQVERDRADLFAETHRLDEQLQQAHSELERLKARLSRSSQEMVSIVVLAVGWDRWGGWHYHLRLKARLSRSSQEMVSIVVLAIG